MLKRDALYHYGIKKHILGRPYKEDFFVNGSDFRPLSYIYKQSAQFICDELQSKDKYSKYYVARYE